MAETITFRPDDDTSRALAVLTADGTHVSAAVRSALIDAAAARARSRLRAEAVDLAADPDDRAESARVLRDMTSCRCPGGSSPRPRPAHGRRRSDHRSRSGRQLTRVLAEQTTSIDPQRLGANAGFLSGSELRRVDAALRLVLDL